MTTWRRTSLALAMAAGLGLSQAPEYAQQYRQRLGGAIDELQAIVVAFDADSHARGMTRAEGIAYLAQSPDPFVRQRGERVSQEIERLGELRRMSDELQGGSPLALVFGVMTHPDLRIGRGAFDEYKPALPLTAAGAICAGAGFMLVLTLLRLAGLPVRRLRRRRQAREASRGLSPDPGQIV